MSARPPLMERVLRVIDQHGMTATDGPVLLMVSGGSDSTALAYLATDLRAAGHLNDLGILHVNHQLRGQASKDDAHFVACLAKHLELPLFMREVDIVQQLSTQGGNMEALARNVRYRAAREALKELCQRAGCTPDQGCIFTAHTADDRVEAFYMRSIVGTGPGGFRAMRHCGELEGCRVCHPLLEEGREELRAAIEKRTVAVTDETGARWREDATNADINRFRAFVRHEVVPLAKKRNPRLLDTLTRTMNLIAEEDDMLDAQAQALLDAYAEPLGATDAEGVLLRPEVFTRETPLVRRALARLLARMLPTGERIEAATIEACMAGLGIAGYVANIQGNLAVSCNKHGLRIEPMDAFRVRRKY